MDIKEAVALVTGGANGLGLAIAIYLQEQGARVVVVDLDSDALAALPEAIDGLELDVTHPDDARAVVNEIFGRYGRIDILVNNAGVIYSEPMVNIMNPTEIMHNYDRFRDSIVVNMDSVFIMTSEVVERMVLARLKGCIETLVPLVRREMKDSLPIRRLKPGSTQ